MNELDHQFEVAVELDNARDERFGIPTLYAGTQFRSRLESRWACFFDLIGWAWEYEPIDLAGYIPDFVLPFEAGPLLVEVKPAFSLEELELHGPKIEASGWEHEALIVGALLPGNYFSPIIGLLSQRPSQEDGWWWERGELIGCSACKRPSLYHPIGVWRCYRCGAAGKIYNGVPTNFRTLWRASGNRTQWKSPR